MRTVSRRLAARSRAFALLLILALAGAPAALAYWATSGSGSATGAVGALSAPQIGSATAGAGTVAVNWTAVSAPAGGTVSYYVTRDGAAASGACPSAATPSAQTSCTDTGVPIGSHSYAVVAVWRSWTATSASMAVEVQTGPATHLVLTPATATPTAGAGDELTIVAKDASENTVAGYTGAKSLTFAGASTIGASQPTVADSGGTARAFGTAETIDFSEGVATVSGQNNGVMRLYKAETTHITVTDGTLGNGGGAAVTVGPATASSLTVPTPSAQTAGAPFETTLTALDAYGNTASGYTGAKAIAFSGPSSSPSSTAPKYPASVSFSAGVGAASITLYKAESTTLSANDGSISGGSGGFTVNPATAASLSLGAASATPTAGEADNLSISALDAYGNAATGYAGTHALTFGGASTIGANKPTVSSSSGTATAFGTATPIGFTSGVATVSGANNGAMRLYSAETAKVTVSDGTIGNGAGLSVTVAPAAIASIVVTTPTTQTAGTPFDLAIAAKDTYGNGVSGSQALSFSGPASSPNGTAPSYPSTVSFTSGAGTASVTLADAQSTTITAKQGGVSATGGSFTVNPATATSMSLGAASTTPTAGVADNLTITALDAFGNTATAYTGSKSLTFGGASTIGANKPTVSSSSGTATAFGATTAIAFSSGAATVAGSNNGVMKLVKAETAKITVTDGAISNGTGLSVTVKAAAAAAMAFVNCSLPEATNVTCSGQPIHVANNTNMTFNMQTQDAFGNPSAPTAPLSITLTNSETEKWSIAGSPATIAPPATTSGQVTLKHANNGSADTITAKATGFASATLTAEK
jgi:hypothetical protein